MRLLLAVTARRGRLLAAAAAVALALRVVPAPADDAQFSATVHVDATADSPEKARQLARAEGERKALAEIIARLSGNPDAPQVQKLEPRTIADMVDSFEVADEHMSAVRYLADYTFHFIPSRVRSLAGSIAPGPTATPTATGGPGGAAGTVRLVLPVFADGGKPVLWSVPNPWRAAWEHAKAAGDLRLPLGDLGDVTAIDARRAIAGDAAALAAIAQRNEAADAVVAMATARRQDGRLAAIDVSRKRYRGGKLADAGGDTIEAEPGESESAFLRRAAAAVAGKLAGGASRTAQGRPATLSAVVPIASLGEWIAVRDRLRSVAAVRQLDLLSLSRSEARVAIHYTGTADSLKSSLEASDFTLAGGDPLWRLERTGAAAKP